MASKIQSHNFYVAITPYKVQGVEDQYNELSVFTSYNEYTHQFYVSLQAGYTTTSGGHGSFIMGDSNPLTASTRVYVKESPRNSQKTINEIGAALELAKDIIAALFDDREWDKLKVVVQNVARFGYVEQYKQQAEAYLKGRKGESINENLKPQISNLKIQKNTTMAQNVKAADLIGKVIIIGGTSAKYIVKSIEGDKLQCDFVNDGKTTPMSVSVSQVEKFIADGKWTVETEEVRGKKEDVATEADVAEVQDIVPVVTPRAKSDGGSKTADVPQTSDIKPQTSNKPKDKDVKPADVKPETKQGVKYAYATYQTKKGKTGAKITGFASEDDVFFAMAAEIHASGSYERDKQGNKHYYLCFGPRYAEAAKSICKVLNSDKTVNLKVEECKLIVSQATEELATKREEWKQKREERKAQTSAVSPQPSTEKTYTQTELKEWLRKLNAGTDKEKAAAAKFFNDLAKAA